jgi:hypothetical protein
MQEQREGKSSKPKIDSNSGLYPTLKKGTLHEGFKGKEALI